jgi:hypothetical protein
VVNSGATIGGNLNVNSGATLAPGNNGTGILHVGGTLTLSGTFSLELGGTVAGSGYDQLQIAGVARSLAPL